MGKGGGGAMPQAPEPAPEPVSVEKTKSSALMGERRRRGYASTFKAGTSMSSENKAKTLLGM